AILEGAYYIPTGSAKAGKELLTSGKVTRLIVVIHRIAAAHRPFGINGDYSDIVRQKLLDMGLKEQEFKVIVAPIRHPVTLKEAQTVLDNLAKEKVTSAILMAPSFHTRRSYLAYQYVGEPLKIKIYPMACFTDHQQDKWWNDQTGWRDFGAESIKLLYYLVSGHLPFRFSPKWSAVAPVFADPRIPKPGGRTLG
ncbi:MAG: hypothetical protein L7F78_23865, partial [Syntrophales bacterium LBB04]|nr:hypothetical protein [Syntrophales bacterium LBB04]